MRIIEPDSEIRIYRHYFFSQNPNQKHKKRKRILQQAKNNMILAQDFFLHYNQKNTCSYGHTSYHW